MPLTICQEVVRVHPGLPMSDRVAWEDTVLPLSTPITNTQGQTITEIPISKGQHIVVATASFNRYSCFLVRYLGVLNSNLGWNRCGVRMPMYLDLLAGLRETLPKDQDLDLSLDCEY